MTEQQVAELSNNRVPDRVVMKTCGTETSAPFPFKVYVYAGGYGPVTMTRSTRSFSTMPGVGWWLASGSVTIYVPLALLARITVCRLTACSLYTAGYAGRSL